jgi:putative PIN family toxin of toxin-antitoxin system
MIMLDTNVVLDAIIKREPYSQCAKEIIALAIKRKFVCCITTNTVTDIIYVLRKHFDKRQLIEKLDDLFSVFEILEISSSDCKTMFDVPINDFEDAILINCAARNKCDLFITRDEEILSHGTEMPIGVITPSAFQKRIA